MRLAKWQGLGNVYLVVEESRLPGPLDAEAVGLLCDYHIGVGSDGILVHARPTGRVAGAAARMRVLNPDGSEPEMCGNGIRIFARYLAGCGAVSGPEFVVETLAGPVVPRILEGGEVRVDMGRALFRSGSVDFPGSEDVIGEVLQAGGCEYEFTFVDVGNPHCVIRVDDPGAVCVGKVGPSVERHPIFPNRANVEFIKVEEDGSVTMRVWERGVGETQACGTGATAVAAACVRRGWTAGSVTVHLPGGDLVIEVGVAEETAGGGARAGLPVFMTGPAVEVCQCDLSNDLLGRLGWPAGAGN